jgi:hypothetical protein
MDRDKLRELREHLDFVDDRFTHRVRPAQGGSLVRPGIEDLERRQRDLAEYAVELKETLRPLLELLDSST